MDREVKKEPHVCDCKNNTLTVTCAELMFNIDTLDEVVLSWDVEYIFLVSTFLEFFASVLECWANVVEVAFLSN